LNITFPSIPYIFQIKKFVDNKSSVGFSRKVSLIIIIGSILRVFFWFGRKFHWTLLAQSCLLILMQLIVIQFAIKYRQGAEDKTKVLLEQGTVNKFLNWENILFYIAFLVMVIIILEILSAIFTFQNVYYVETLGTISSILEAALAFPQIIENCRYKSTSNLSNVLVGCWILGDSLKTFYYYNSDAPIQLLISGFVQIFLDLIIVLQVFIYRNNKINPKETQ
jgi:hypothetical protein